MFLILVAILAVTVIYLKLIKPFSYWKDRGVKQREAVHLFGDNFGVLFRTETFFDFMRKLYNAYPEERCMGMYEMITPTLLLRDPDLIKQITVKDFDHFLDHRTFVPDGVDDLWSRNLFALKGNRWRDMRSTLSPSFTTSKIKMIFNLVSECALEFNKYFLNPPNKDVQSVELKDLCTRYTNDVIATVAFGVKCDSLREPNNEFYIMGKEATNFTGFWKNLKFFAFILIPKICKILGLTMFRKDVNKFFKRVVRENIKFREEKGIVRPDMLQLLMEARKGRSEKEENNEVIDTGFATVEELNLTTNNKIVRQEITDIDITAQALIFFFGGFESVSTLMCFMGHELVEHLDIQHKLQKEVDETLKECNGILTYEALLKMKYMDMVICETLRKWPVVIAIDRVCTQPYTIQPSKATEKPIHLEKGHIVSIPITGLHYDPQYFPNPELFDPERFNDENKDDIKPYTYLPFGVGPRNCIGSRFALIETKTIFFHLLSKFDLVRVDKTQIPLKLSKKTFNLLAENGFWIGLKLRIGVK